MKRPFENLRWIIAAVIFLNTVINYIDRQTLSVLAPTLTKTLHLSDVQYGYIVQAFLISYTAMYIPAGLAFDRWGIKRVFTAATLLWSVAAILPAFARSAWDLGFYRLLLGIGEAFTFIGATAVSSEWYPPRERAMLSGFANAAAVTGAIISPPLVVWMFLNWGWQVAFVATGVLGLLWVGIWLLVYARPAEHPRITPVELRLIQEVRDGDKPANSAAAKPSWWELLKMRETWGLLLSRVFSDPVWWFYLFWLPKYLADARHFSMKQIGFVVWIPYLASDIGSVAGGWASGWLIRRSWPVIAARRIVMLLSVCVMPLGIVMAYTSSSTYAIVLVCIVLFAHMSWKTNLMTLTVDVYPKPVIATVAGIVGAGGGFGAALFTSLAGHLIQSFSYMPVLWIMGFAHPIAYLFVRWLVRPDVRLKREVPGSSNVALPGGSRWRT